MVEKRDGAIRANAVGGRARCLGPQQWWLHERLPPMVVRGGLWAVHRGRARGTECEEQAVRDVARVPIPHLRHHHINLSQGGDGSGQGGDEGRSPRGERVAFG